MVASRDTIDRVVTTYQQAVAANHACKARRGNAIHLSSETADEVVITADLHGHRPNFDRLCEVADLPNRPRRHLIMQEVCHGGPLYPSGNACMSHLLLEAVAQMKVAFPERFHFLPGNHELAELTDFPIVKSRRILNVLFRCGLEEMYGQQSERVRQAALEFIRTSPLAVQLSNRVFVSHSLPERVDTEGFDQSIFDRPVEPSDLERGGAVFRLLWGRDYRPENAAAFARLVNADVLINGHEPCESGFRTPNEIQIILDCCGDQACYVVLPLGERFTQQQIVARIERLP